MGNEGERYKLLLFIRFNYRYQDFIAGGPHHVSPQASQGAFQTKTNIPWLHGCPFLYVFRGLSPFGVLSVPRTQLTKSISVGHMIDRGHCQCLRTYLILRS